jgi:hypothetical protein
MQLTCSWTASNIFYTDGHNNPGAGADHSRLGQMMQNLTLTGIEAKLTGGSIG